MQHPLKHRSRDHGVALILVILIVSLASMLVINLAYSTILGSRVSANLLQSTQAEYILKSAVNVARALIREDKTPEDSPEDLWATFSNGTPIPPNLVGVPDQNVIIELEIRPEDSKLPINALMTSGLGAPEAKWVSAFTNLFQNPLLDFDNDGEEDQTGFFPNRHFSSAELVALLVDYMDSNKDPFKPDGIEGDPALPEDLFPNKPFQRISELSTIPGFTPARVRKLIPLVSGLGGKGNQVNINFAPSIVIKSLSADIDDQMVTAIRDFIKSEEGPFTDENKFTKLPEIVGATVHGTISNMIKVETKTFQVIAKVNYGTAVYFMRAYLSKAGKGELPEIVSVEMF